MDSEMFDGIGAAIVWMIILFGSMVAGLILLLVYLFSHLSISLSWI